MEKILNCIEETMNDLEREIMAIVSDQSIPMTEKNRLMAPIVDRKKVLQRAQADLERIQNTTYEAKCGMQAYRMKGEP